MLARRLAFASLLSLSATTAGAVSLIPLTDNPGGQSPATSAEDWTKWLYSFNSVTDGGDPVSDQTGAMQPLNQNYPVFLLGGTFGGEAARSFSAPSGSIFMLPFTNIFCTGDMPDSPPPWTPCTEADKAGSIAALDETDRLFLNIDGTSYVDATTVEEVASIRDEFWIQTGIFPAEMAENNFWDALGYDAPPGTYATNYNVGFYAFAKLGSGTHTLQWGGGRADFTNMITATITIEPVPLPAGLPLLAAGLGALGLAGRWRRRVAV